MVTRDTRVPRVCTWAHTLHPRHSLSQPLSVGGQRPARTCTYILRLLSSSFSGSSASSSHWHWSSEQRSWRQPGTHWPLAMAQQPAAAQKQKRREPRRKNMDNLSYCMSYSLPSCAGCCMHGGERVECACGPRKSGTQQRYRTHRRQRAKTDKLKEAYRQPSASAGFRSERRGGGGSELTDGAVSALHLGSSRRRASRLGNTRGRSRDTQADRRQQRDEANGTDRRAHRVLEREGFCLDAAETLRVAQAADVRNLARTGRHKYRLGMQPGRWVCESGLAGCGRLGVQMGRRAP